MNKGWLPLPWTLFVAAGVASGTLLPLIGNFVQPRSLPAVSNTSGSVGVSSPPPMRPENIEFCRHHQEALDLYHLFRGCTDTRLAPAINNALDCLHDAIRLYGPKRLISSFNGGKDAVVVMHLLRAAMAKFSHDNNRVERPQFIYFAIDHEFDEVLEFIEACEYLYNLKLTKYDCGIIQVSIGF